MLSNIQLKIENLINEFVLDLQNSKNTHDILQVKAKYLGKDSFLHLELLNIKNYSIEEKKTLGPLINQAKNDILEKINQALNLQEDKSGKKFLYDDYLYIKHKKIGSIHPITKMINLLSLFLNSYNFQYVKSQEIEDDWHNFEGLNIAKNHPSRQMHDTFYMQNSNLLLRTHTSNMQIRFMKNNKPPFKFYSYGRTYRKDSDRTHTPMFHQFEMVFVDKDINFANLKWFLIEFLQYIFGKDIEVRLRPSFFPFTQPSVEVDIKLNGKWLEVLGSGMIHNNVLQNVGIDSNEFQGFAIGAGLDRLAMIKYNILDLRTMFESNINFIQTYNIKWNNNLNNNF
ncbi:MAG: phenylalanine--tRNA ligase subunit alpha [Rickettsiales bacterium]